MSRTEIPDELPLHRNSRVVAQRAAPIPRPVWCGGARTALLTFTRQVLLRPTRIGTLALLGGMIAVVLVGAEGWWIVLGITLFHAAACTLIAMWIVPPTGLPRQITPRTNRVGNPPRSWVVNRVPRQRQPGPDE